VCPVGLVESICVVLWEEYNVEIKNVAKRILFLFLAAANLVLWW